MANAHFRKSSRKRFEPALSRCPKVLRHELIDTYCGVTCRDGLECCLEICIWFDIVELAGLDERRDAAPVSAAFIMSCKERVLAVQGDGSDAAFHDIAIHLDGAVGEEDLQSCHVFCNVAELLAKAELGRDAGPLGSEPDLEVIHQRLGAGLALTRHAIVRRQSRPSNKASNCAFDSRMIPSCILGHAKLPLSNRL